MSLEIQSRAIGLALDGTTFTAQSPNPFYRLSGLRYWQIHVRIDLQLPALHFSGRNRGSRSRVMSEQLSKIIATTL
jgi:hypothetical protein